MGKVLAALVVAALSAGAAVPAVDDVARDCFSVRSRSMDIERGYSVGGYGLEPFACIFNFGLPISL